MLSRDLTPQMICNLGVKVKCPFILKTLFYTKIKGSNRLLTTKAVCSVKITGIALAADNNNADCGKWADISDCNSGGADRKRVRFSISWESSFHIDLRDWCNPSPLSNQRGRHVGVFEWSQSASHPSRTRHCSWNEIAAQRSVRTWVSVNSRLILSSSLVANCLALDKFIYHQRNGQDWLLSF